MQINLGQFKLKLLLRPLKKLKANVRKLALNRSCLLTDNLCHILKEMKTVNYKNFPATSILFWFQNINNDNNNDNNNNNNNDNFNMNTNGRRKRSQQNLNLTEAELEDLLLIESLIEKPMTDLEIARKSMELFMKNFWRRLKSYL